MITDQTIKLYCKVLCISLLVGVFFWFIDGYFEFVFFHQNLTFLVLEGPETLLESLFLKVPRHSLFVRLSFIIACLVGGFIVAFFFSRRKKAERIIKDSEERFKSLISTIPDLVWLKDPDGVYLACNSKFESFFGAKERDIVGKTDYDFVDKELADMFRTYDEKAMEQGKVSLNEEKVTFASDGHHEILETIKTPMYKDDGQLAGVLGIGRNITDRITMQAKLTQSQKMESIGRLAGGVAHDYNNALSVIIGFIELSLDGIDPKSLLYDNLAEALGAANRAKEITKQLLAFARKQTIAPKVLDLNNSMEEMLKMLLRLVGENIDLVWLPMDDLWVVKMDPSQVNQVLTNLCVNARDSIKDVGEITIETGMIEFDEEYCADHLGFKPGQFVRLSVSDDGCGMDQDTIKKIFEPFYTTKDVDKGTGLGLATVYGIVKQNNSFINVYSELGKGTAVSVYIPKHKGELGKSIEKKIDDVPLGNNETILIVEDDLAILKLTQKILEGQGYRLIIASSPEEALSKVREHPDKIHLLITDVIMPKMNGRDLSEQLLSIIPSMKCMFMSGYTANVIGRHGVLDKESYFIQKPFSKTELLEIVRKVLNEK